MKTVLSSSVTLDCLPLSHLAILDYPSIKILTRNFKFHISSLARAASVKLSVLCLRQFYSPCRMLALDSGLGRTCWGGSTHKVLLSRVKSKTFRLINSPPLTDCLRSLRHCRSVGSLSIFCRCFHGYCSSDLSNCMPLPPSPIPILSISLMQELNVSSFLHPFHWMALELCQIPTTSTFFL